MAEAAAGPGPGLGGCGQQWGREGCGSWVPEEGVPGLGTVPYVVLRHVCECFRVGMSVRLQSPAQLIQYLESMGHVDRGDPVGTPS